MSIDRSVSGRYGVAKIHGLGEKDTEFIFCVLPNPYYRIINDDTRRILGLCEHGSGQTNLLTKC